MSDSLDDSISRRTRSRGPVPPLPHVLDVTRRPRRDPLASTSSTGSTSESERRSLSTSLPPPVSAPSSSSPPRAATTPPSKYPPYTPPPVFPRLTPVRQPPPTLVLTPPLPSLVPQVPTTSGISKPEPLTHSSDSDEEYEDPEGHPEGQPPPNQDNNQGHNQENNQEDDQEDESDQEDTDDTRPPRKTRSPEPDPSDPSDPEDSDSDMSEDQRSPSGAAPKSTAFIACSQDLEALERELRGIAEPLQDHVNGTHKLTLTRAKLAAEDLKDLKKELSALHSQCHKTIPDIKTGLVDGELTEMLREYDQVMYRFTQARQFAADIVEELTTSTHSGLKPPKLSLPTFKGIHSEWPTFRTAFSTMVKDCNKFSPSEKLRLLREALLPPANDNIRHLDVTDENWTIAWSRLTERYDSPREAAHAAIKPLLDLPALMSQTENGIYRMLSTALTTKAQLDLIKLGDVSQIEVMISHHLMARLDAKTIKEFYKSLPDQNVPSLDTLTKWLSKEAKSIGLTNQIKHNNAGPGESRGPRQPREHKPSSVLAIQEPKKPARGRSSTPKGRSASHQQRREITKRPSTDHVGKSKIQARSSTPHSRAQSPHQAACIVCASSVHRTNQCPEFLGMNTSARKDWIRSNNRCYNCLGNHSVKACTSKYACAKCQKRHHTLIHTDASLSTIMTSCRTAHDAYSVSTNMGLLPTAVVTVEKSHDDLDQARCLLDSGASGCFITLEAVKRFGLTIEGKPERFTVAGGRSTQSLGRVTLHIRNRTHPAPTFLVDATVLSQLTTTLPAHEVDTSDWTHLKHLPLADPTFHTPGQIDMLLGCGFVDFIARGKKIEGKPGTPSAYLTEFGYVIQGYYGSDTICSVVTSEAEKTALLEPKGIKPVMCPGSSTAKDEASLFRMQKFWEIEDLPQTPVLTPMEQECENHFKQNTVRLWDGRFQVKWPFIASPSLLGDSYKAALSRWYSMEKKLVADPELAADYHGQLDDYLKNGQLELIPPQEMNNRPHYWIPHHAVFKPSSTTTKMRIVFDASAKTSSGKSMNGLLSPGPVIQAPLFDQLLNFRLKKVGMTADIARMYRQVFVDPSERDLARIIWRKTPDEPLRYYRHISIPFGFASSPFLATRCLQELAREEQHRFPLAAKALLTSFYVDDFLFSEDSVDKAIKFKNELLELLGTAYMNLRKWSSNSSELLESLPVDLRETQLPLDLNKTTIGTLGMRWNPASDTFQYTVTLPPQDYCTKRSVLSDISKIFDPLGLLAPTIIIAKIFMQDVWSYDLMWDDYLSLELLEEWYTFARELPNLEKITIPRWLGASSDADIQLHGFCDASAKAYAAAIYLRTTINGVTTCRLIASKSKVAPLKTTTIPRLELQGAVLLAELMAHVREQYQVPQEKVYLWTDSTICLYWIWSHPSKWKIYVANRVTQIHEHSLETQWHHVISEENPADHGSRGLMPQDLLTCTLWWNGPTWLCEPFIPPAKGILNEPRVEELPMVQKELKPSRPHIMVTTSSMEPHFLVRCLSRISSWTKAVRVTALISAIQVKKSFRGAGSLQLASNHIAQAEIQLIKLIQDISYPNLPDAIKAKFPRNYGNYQKFKNLHLFMAEDGIIRVGGRLQHSALPYGARHPALLPGSHPLVRALIFHTHVTLAHAGRNTTHSHLRQKFWIPNATKSIKSVIDKCLLCFRYAAQPTTQLMGQLPSARVNATRPFLHTGVDYFGPYELKSFVGRSGKYKVWVALFTCMATRAIHLELVSTLSQFGFLLAFRRFIARRGKPTHMYSDQGTNFVGANSHMKSVRTRQITSQALTSALIPDLDLDKIVWKFNPPSAPSQGGVWESCVKLVKTHLKKLILEDSHTWETFESLLLFVEAIVNSRPLTPLSEDPNDLEALTPAHFLIGVSPSMIPEDDLSHLRLNRLDKYQTVIRRQQELWKRWQTDYITALQKRPKWAQETSGLDLDQMVLIIDDQAPPLQWRIGRIKAIHPGADGLVRVTTVETDSTYQTDKTGKLVKVAKEFQRPISKLARIPIEEDEQDPRIKALPYPVQPPAVLSIARPTRLHPVPASQWLYTIMLAASTQLNGAHGANLSNTTVDADSSFPYPVSYANFVVILLTLFAIVGTFGNLGTIIALSRTPAIMAKPVHWLILSLCVSDLLFSATSLPLAIIRLHYRRWIFSEDLCNFSAFLLFGNIMCSMSHLLAITLNRYVKIVFTHAYPSLYSRKTVKTSILLTWILTFGSLLPTLTGLWGQMGPKPNDISSCTIIPDQHGRSPIAFIWTLGNVVPISLMIWCYGHIIVHVHRSRNLVRQLSDPEKQTNIPIGRPSHTLTKMTCFIVGGYLLAFEPILILNWLDTSEMHIPPSVHLFSAIMAWTTAWLNLIIYVTTNRDYRQAYSNLFGRGRTRTSSSTSYRSQTTKGSSTSSSMRSQNSMTTTITRTLIGTALVGSALGLHQPSPDLTAIALPCSETFEAHHVIPPCVQTVHWLHILSNGTICTRTVQCPQDHIVQPDAKGCTAQTCDKYQVLHLDALQCQDNEDTALVAPLSSPPLQSHLCSVSGLTLRTCAKYTESYEDVPIAIIKHQAYPLDILHTVQHASMKNISSYTCKGSCKDQCAKNSCTGDVLFCTHFPCAENNGVRRNCECVFNSASITHIIPTNLGNVTPNCWGSMRVPIRKELHHVDPDEYPCDGCSISCTETGIQVVTPGRVSRYIRVLKNPGHISTMPTSSTTDVHLTHNMLATTGPLTVEMWFQDFDIPSIRTHHCPRIPICKLIRCHLCVARWLNVSCYDYYHLIVLSSLGLVIALAIVCAVYIMKTVIGFYWLLLWPLRTMLRLCVNYRSKHTARDQARTQSSTDTTIELPLLPMTPNPYGETTRGLRRPRHRSYLMSICLLLTLATPVTRACSNFAMLSAPTTECDYSSTTQRRCNLRINTRLAISPIGQRSCLRLDDSRNGILGTITIQTKSISVRCQKELLYYTPRAASKCDSSQQCFNIMSDHECTYNSCADFGINGTIRAFSHSMDHLGWSACYPVLPGCFWPQTHDCHFARTYLVNPTQQTYAVSHCPQWSYAATLEVAFHLGKNVTTDTVTLYAGKDATVNQVDLSLISVTMPPIPTLTECIIANSNTMAMTPCNVRNDLSTNRIGEIQCNSAEDAQVMNNHCLGSIDLVHTQVDDNGVQCHSDLVDPELILKRNPLPLKLASGVLIPFEDSISYEVSGSAMLEIQLNTNSLVITQEVETVKCEAQVIKLTGCYSCLSGAVLFISAKTDEGSTTGALECPTIGFFTPVFVTNNLTTYQIVMKIDQPDVDLECTFKCTQQSIPLKITAHLQYLQNVDMRRAMTTTTHEPSASLFDGFSFLSLYGNNLTNWLTRGLVLLVVCILAYAMFTIAFQTILKKLV